MAILAEYGIESVGEVMDRDPFLAYDDAVRAHEPSEVLLSCLADTRYGITRKDLVEWARKRVEPEIAFTHIPVRVADDSVSWEKSHTLVVATQTVAAPDLVGRLKERAAGHPHRYTIICPRAEDVTEAEIVADLASTLAELYRNDIDATGQPMSPDPFHAVKNAIEHYSIDEVLISTFAGEDSRWLDEDLIGRTREITDKQVEHLEVGRPAAAVAAAVAEGRLGGPRDDGRPREVRSDGERHRRGRPRPRGAPRPAGGQPELADRPSDPRHPALHRLRDHALRRLLRGLLLPPRRRQPAQLAAGSLRTAGARRPGQHLHPRLLELHDPLRPGGDPQGQPQRPQTRPRADLDARRHLPLHPDQRVRAHRLQRPGPGLRLDLLQPHGAARRPRLRRPDAAQLRHDPRLPRPFRARGQGPPGRRGARHLLALRRRHVDRGFSRPFTFSRRTLQTGAFRARSQVQDFGYAQPAEIRGGCVSGGSWWCCRARSRWGCWRR